MAAKPRLPSRVTRRHRAENWGPWLQASIESRQKRAQGTRVLLVLRVRRALPFFPSEDVLHSRVPQRSQSLAGILPCVPGEAAQRQTPGPLPPNTVTWDKTRADDFSG